MSLHTYLRNPHDGWNSYQQLRIPMIDETVTNSYVSP